MQEPVPTLAYGSGRGDKSVQAFGSARGARRQQVLRLFTNLLLWATVRQEWPRL